jgi:hypothetical protein
VLFFRIAVRHISGQPSRCKVKSVDAERNKKSKKLRGIIVPFILNYIEIIVRQSNNDRWTIGRNIAHDVVRHLGGKNLRLAKMRFLAHYFAVRVNKFVSNFDEKS